MIQKPVKWETEIGKMEFPCTHDDIEYEYDYSDGYPLLEGAVCEECGKDITDELTEAEVSILCEQEVEDYMARQIEAAMGYEQDLRAGLI